MKCVLPGFLKKACEGRFREISLEFLIEFSDVISQTATFIRTNRALKEAKIRNDRAVDSFVNTLEGDVGRIAG